MSATKAYVKFAQVKLFWNTGEPFLKKKTFFEILSFEITVS